MTDFPIKFTMISTDKGLARLASLSGQELTVPADILQGGVLGGGMIEIPLGSLMSGLDDKALSNLSQILIGCPR
jgi:hypothetical protein